MTVLLLYSVCLLLMNVLKFRTLVMFLNMYYDCFASKISNTFLNLPTTKMLGWKSQNCVRIANREDPDQTPSSEAGSLISVCTVCLGLFRRQLVFESLGHLPFYLLFLPFIHEK